MFKFLRVFWMIIVIVSAVILSTNTNTEVGRVEAIQVPSSLQFELPYYATDPIPYWSGGLHQWGENPNQVYFELYEGSGLDFAMCAQTFSVAAMAEGDVIYAGTLNPDNGLGTQVAIKHTYDDSVIIYGHLDSIWEPLLKAYEQGEAYHVLPGYTIGKAGDSGFGADSIHLHIELRDGSRDCCGRGLDGGDPVSWHGRIINGYQIFDVRPNELGIPPDCTSNSSQETCKEVAFNYEGVAVRVEGIHADWWPVEYDHFSFYDLSGSTTRTGVWTFLPRDFQCDGVSNCMKNGRHPNAIFAGSGREEACGSERGGGFLESDLEIPDLIEESDFPQIQSVNVTPVNGTRLVRETNQSEYPVMMVNYELEFSADIQGYSTEDTARLIARNLLTGSTMAIAESALPLYGSFYFNAYQFSELTMYDPSVEYHSYPKVELCIETSWGGWYTADKKCTTIAIVPAMGCIPVAEGGQGCPDDFPDWGELEFYSSQDDYWPSANQYCDHDPVWLIVSDYARITPGDANRLRSYPQNYDNSNVIGSIPGEGEFTVVNGPVCSNGWWWWKVDYQGQIGWTANGNSTTPWVETLRSN